MKLLFVLAFAGCVGPQVFDDSPIDDSILPPGTMVDSVESDPILRAQLVENDGVPPEVARVTAFAAGALLRGWDFGAAPSFAAPLFVLVRREAAMRVPIDHPTIIDAMPGDAGYSPYWAVFFVEVTSAYAGERLPSFAAVGAAQRAGLVLAPEPQPFAVNCPAVASDVKLDVGGAWVLPQARFYYRGRTVPYYDFGPMPLEAGVFVPEQERYVIRRDGEEWLSEVRRGVDIDGDGDTTDTNDIEAHAPGAPDRSPSCRIVEVTVRRGTASIDTSGDEAIADLTSANQLFAPAPRPVVVAFRRTPDLRNCPVQRTPGAPR